MMDAHIDHHHIHARIVRHRIAGGALRDHIGLRHADRRLLRVGRHALFVYPVVAACDHHTPLRDIRHGIAGDTDVARHHILHLAKVSHTEVQIMPALPGLLHGFLAERLDPIQRII